MTNSSVTELMQELWHPIEGHAGYEVSNLGKSEVVVAFLKEAGRAVGAITALLIFTQTGQGAITFTAWWLKLCISNPLNLPEVNHKDGCKSNNRVDNLEWSTTADNQEHSIRSGLRKV